MNNITYILSVMSVILIISANLSANIYAATSYTINQIKEHNSANDCWMIINQNVYNVTDYLTQHDRQLDIRPWCGKDATTEYNTKNGQGVSHSNRADNLLNQYIIGSLNIQEQTNTTNNPTITENPKKAVSYPDKYNVYIPIFGTLLVYFLSLKVLKRQTHNFIWNSIMLLGLIPSFGFGMIMALAKQFPLLNNLTKGNMLYNHVELSIMFGTACILHFLFRLKIYSSQGKIAIRK